MSDYQHILVGIDFAESTSKILTHAVDIAQRNNASISLLHIVEYLPPIDSAYEPVLASNWDINEGELIEQGKLSLEQLSHSYPLDSLQSGYKLKVLTGTPKTIISNYAKEHNCDLIILGSHGRHGIQRLLGSTASAILNDMPCDILALKIDSN